MLYFVCAIWEELLHSFLWILHVPFSADSVCGVMVKYMRSSPFWPGVLWWAGVWRKDKFTSVPEAQGSFLVWSTLLALSGLGVYCLPQDRVALLGSLCPQGAGMEQRQVLDSWQHAVPVSLESLWECSAVIQAQCSAVLEQGVNYFSGCCSLLPAGHCWGMHPAIAVSCWTLPCLSSSSPLLLWLCPLPWSPSSPQGCDSGVAAVPVSAPSLPIPSCCTDPRSAAPLGTQWLMWPCGTVDLRFVPSYLYPFATFPSLSSPWK